MQALISKASAEQKLARELAPLCNRTQTAAQAGVLDALGSRRVVSNPLSWSSGQEVLADGRLSAPVFAS